MKLLPILLLYLLFCSFGINEVTFEVLKKSDKSLPRQSGSMEFYSLPANIDTSKFTFVAEVKLKGENITVFDIYHRLRLESQNLGANSFQVINKAKGGDNYYLLCKIYLADTAILGQIKRSDPDNGKIFIISPEPLKYLNKDRVRINNTKKITLVSGSYFIVKQENSLITLKSKELKAKIVTSKNEVKYCTTRYFSTFNASQLSDFPISSNGNGVSVRINSPMITKESFKGNIKHTDGSIENGFGKLMLQFSKPAAIK